MLFIPRVNGLNFNYKLCLFFHVLILEVRVYECHAGNSVDMYYLTCTTKKNATTRRKKSLTSPNFLGTQMIWITSITTRKSTIQRKKVNHECMNSSHILFSESLTHYIAHTTIFFKQLN